MQWQLGNWATRQRGTPDDWQATWQRGTNWMWHQWASAAVRIDDTHAGHMWILCACVSSPQALYVVYSNCQLFWLLREFTYLIVFERLQQQQQLQQQRDEQSSATKRNADRRAMASVYWKWRIKIAGQSITRMQCGIYFDGRHTCGVLATRKYPVAVWVSICFENSLSLLEERLWNGIMQFSAALQH